MWLKFLVNRIKIDRFRALRRGPENWCELFARSFGAKFFTTNCYGEINRYEWRTSGFMKKLNGGLYRVTRFACDNNELLLYALYLCQYFLPVAYINLIDTVRYGKARKHFVD